MEVARKAVAQKVGEEAVKAMHAVVTLEIQEIRPLSGVGQSGVSRPQTSSYQLKGFSIEALKF